ADDLPLADVAAEAATRLPMALAGVAEELGAAITRCRLAFPAPEAQSPDHTWCVTVTFGAEAAALSFSCPAATAAPRETTYLAEHVQAVFRQLGQNPAAPVGYVFFLAEAEVAQLRHFRTGPAQVAEGGPQLLHQLFTETARTYPNQVALNYLGTTRTYRELNEQADQLAARLQHQGVQAGDFVGLLLAKSLELYVGMLAVLKAGAAYVPLDLSFPPDRVAFILEDCGARALLINQTLPEGLATWPGLVLDLAVPAPVVPSLLEPVAVGPDSVAYVIYTSGTTGLPKGVLIPHRSICHLVRAEQLLFQPTPQDRVVQGFSVAFDASLEELWLAWAAGATLVPVPEETMKAPDALPAFLVGNQVTVFSTVPTLLSLLPATMPTLRLLILGGEVCPPELLAKWASRQCRVVNTYGPTEATVVATAADFVPGHKLTIGRPLAGYEVLILDQLGQLVPLGAAGELCIGGPALAAGYLNRPELSASKFNTASELANGFAGRLYRTGDLARFEADGSIDFLGRIDTQVKIRGFRVELAEIESLLLQWPGIRNAAVALKEGADGVKKLIAYLILDPNQLLDERAVRAYLRERLAPYMLPAALVPFLAFPLLTSGKVDRKALPYPVSGDAPPSRALTLPRTPTEATIYAAWQKRFDTSDLSTTDDFFDLGGNSLLASLIISELRQLPDFQGLSVKEMYTRRTVAALAAAVDAEARRTQAAPAAPEPVLAPLRRASVGTRLATATLQLATVGLTYAVPILLLNGSLHWRGLLGGWSWEALTAMVIIATLAYVPLSCLLVVALKWLVIGRFRAGEYPLWGFYYYRFWVVKKLVEAAPTQLLSATPFLAVFYRLLGAKIGKNVYLGTTRVMTFDLLTLHDGASLAREAGLLGYRVERGRLILGPITVGRDAYVGLRAILENDTQVGYEAELDDLSVLPAGQQIPAREGWLGSPAQLVRTLASVPPTSRPAPSASYQALQLLAIALMLLVPTLASVPVLGIFYEAVERLGFEPALLTLLPLSALYVGLLGLLLVLIKRLVAGRQPDGELPLYSPAYVRHWLADAVMAQSLALLKSVYATLYAPYWLRLLGAKIGRRAEISTLNHISADHLTVGAGAFLADSVSVGAPRVQRGIVSV
ncbi:MAG: amino acid adenylation domain-containing protein, partial [Hymenobacter sp.]